jgi:hypothetical protein
VGANSSAQRPKLTAASRRYGRMFGSGEAAAT